MNAPAKMAPPIKNAPTEKQQDEFALHLIRLVSRNLKLIDETVSTLGVALAQGRCSSRAALKMTEQAAPGCLEAVFLALYENVSPEQLRNMLDGETS